MKIRHLVVASMLALLSVFVILALTTAAMAQPAMSSMPPQMKDDMEQLGMDLHVGIDRSTLSEQQKAQLRDDFRELREAHKNHQMFAAMRAARSIRTALDSGAFKPEDKERIKQDIQAIKEAREEGGGH